MGKITSGLNFPKKTFVAKMSTFFGTPCLCSTFFFLFWGTYISDHHQSRTLRTVGGRRHFLRIFPFNVASSLLREKSRPKKLKAGPQKLPFRTFKEVVHFHKVFGLGQDLKITDAARNLLRGFFAVTPCPLCYKISTFLTIRQFYYLLIWSLDFLEFMYL